MGGRRDGHGARGGDGRQLEAVPIHQSAVTDARLLRLWGFPSKNTEMICHFLLQGIFLTLDQEPTSSASPALAGRFFFHWATREAFSLSLCAYIYIFFFSTI